MSSETTNQQEQAKNQPTETNSDLEQIRSDFQQIAKEFKSLKEYLETKKTEKIHSKEEIREIAEKRIKEREVEQEMKKIESEKSSELSKKDVVENLKKRNMIEKEILQEFIEGKYTTAQFRNAENNPEFMDLLGRSLFRYLAPQCGIPESVIDASNPWDLKDWYNQLDPKSLGVDPSVFEE